MTEGERWARELLADLRATRFGRRAWQHFLAQSLERADERRRERDREHRQALLLGALGLTAWVAVALAGEPALAAVGAAWWALTILMLDWHLGMLERRDGSPLGTIGVPNLLSLARVGAVPALPALAPAVLAVTLAAAAATNALDGRLARRRDQVSRLGPWLDGVGDALVLSTAALLATAHGKLPAWAAALVIARFAVPAVAAVGTYFFMFEPPPASLVRGRMAGAALWAGLVVALLDAPLGAELTALGAVGGLTASVATAWAQRRIDGAWRATPPG